MLAGRSQFLAVGTFSRVFVGQLKGTVNLNRHFVCLEKLFPPIMELIVLARWVKFTTQFIPGLVFIVLSGTESNRGIKFISR